MERIPSELNSSEIHGLSPLSGISSVLKCTPVLKWIRRLLNLIWPKQNCSTELGEVAHLTFLRRAALIAAAAQLSYYKRPIPCRKAGERCYDSLPEYAIPHKLQSGQPVAAIETHIAQTPGNVEQQQQGLSPCEAGRNGSHNETCYADRHNLSYFIFGLWILLKEIPKKTSQPVALSSTNQQCENPGATLPGNELGSPRWGASSLTTTPPQPQTTTRRSNNCHQRERADNFNKKERLTVIDWQNGFPRNPGISMRKPETTSLNWVTGLNKEEVKLLHSNIEKLTRKVTDIMVLEPRNATINNLRAFMVEKLRNSTQ
ncbi:hypothetical protein PR048_010923 [Dryococelus australis]|uniref:Uncharacterized protein n=1 Tax=Dryococelus australis TaxID=614101 RepID=A0ABQ9HK73_9NEOP|nr:hypothetical protein PR048_010923 [Dryococelus australis]